MRVLERRPSLQTAPGDQRSAAAAIAGGDPAPAAAADAFPEASPGPSSAVLELMRQIRRSHSAVDLRMVLSRHSAHVDHLALVAAMTRLAQMSARSRRTAERSAQRQLASELASQLAAPAVLRHCGARQLATCLHCLAEVGAALSMPPPSPSGQGEREGEGGLWGPLLDALCEDRAALLRAGNGVDVSMLALSLARLNCPSRRAWRAVARGVEAHVGSMSPQHVANTLSALARGAAHQHTATFTLLLRRAVTDAEAMSGRNLANALWAAVRHLEALGALPPSPPPPPAAAAAEVASLAAALAGRLPERLRGCPPTELAGVAWSLAQLGWREGKAWERLGAQLRLSAGALKSTELCTTAEALQTASAAARSAAAAEAVAARAAPGPQPPQPSASAGAAGSATEGGEVGTPAAAAAAEGGAVAASAAGGLPSADPGEHLGPLFAAAALRCRELRPHHLARLLAVLRQQQQQEQHNQQQQRPWVVGDPVLAGFVEEARSQLLRTPLSAFTQLSVITSLVGSLGSRHSASSEASRPAAPAAALPAAGPAAEPRGAAIAPGGSPDALGAAAQATSSPQPAATATAATAGAVLDHLAAAAAPLVAAAAAAAAELRSVVAAFAAAGHMNAELCTAVAARVEALARQVNTHSITTGLQALAEHSARQRRRQQRQRREREREQTPQEAGLRAAVGEVGDLVSALRSLALLGFHNEAALDAAAPAVAAAVPALPPAALSAALASYSASGAPPLALAAALASRLLEQLPPAPAPGRGERYERAESEGEEAGEGSEGRGVGLGCAERQEVLEACEAWRGALLYPGGLAGAAAARVAGGDRSGDGGLGAGGVGIGGQGGGGVRAARHAGGDVAVFPAGFDRCTELVLRLQSRAAG
ncbi:hypothetical protein PLESTM_001134500 [Pleodorina starrii]|nr:hypothetical protein PLESTM_001134500 [Pleodorina starrii]